MAPPKTQRSLTLQNVEHRLIFLFKLGKNLEEQKSRDVYFRAVTVQLSMVPHKAHFYITLRCVT